MSKMPVRPAREPVAVAVEAGRDYEWCSCGRSASQPFCDCSHRGTPFRPVRYTATHTCIVYFCVCKDSESGQLCDGSHQCPRWDDARPLSGAAAIR